MPTSWTGMCTSSRAWSAGFFTLTRCNVSRASTSDHSVMDGWIPDTRASASGAGGHFLGLLKRSPGGWESRVHGDLHQRLFQLPWRKSMSHADLDVVAQFRAPSQRGQHSDGDETPTAIVQSRSVPDAREGELHGEGCKVSSKLAG